MFSLKAEHSQRFVLPNFQTQDTRVVTRSASAVMNDTKLASDKTLRYPTGGARKFRSTLRLYSSLIESPRLILPPCTTDAYTPTLTWLCCAAVRRIPGSLGKSRCASVVITQRAQLRSIFRRTLSPIATIRPSQAFSTKPSEPSVDFTTTFGRNLGTAKRPSG